MGKIVRAVKVVKRAPKQKKLIGKRIINKVVQDATGDEITFPDLKEDEGITAGEKAEINNKPATGEFVMPDGSTYVFSNGILNEIIPPDRSIGARNYLAKKRNKTNPTATPENKLAGIRERIQEYKKQKSRNKK